jgi:hypothetical protein
MKTIEDILELIEMDSSTVGKLSTNLIVLTADGSPMTVIEQMIRNVVDFTFNANYNSYAVVNRDSRKFEHKIPRFICFKLLYEQSKMPLERVASKFGKTHATVINGIRKINQEIDDSDILASKVALCLELLTDKNVYNRVFNKKILLLSEASYSVGETLNIRDYLFTSRSITTKLQLKQIKDKLMLMYGDGELIKSETGVYELSNAKYLSQLSEFQKQTVNQLK